MNKALWNHFKQFGRMLGKFICSSLLARLLEVFPAGMAHLQPATWLTGKFPSRRRHTLLAGLGVVIGKNSVTVDYYRHLTNYLWKSIITFRRSGEWLSIFIDWLNQSISLTRFFLIFTDNIDWNQFSIFIDWYRPEVKGRDLGKTYRQADTYYVFRRTSLICPGINDPFEVCF